MLTLGLAYWAVSLLVLGFVVVCVVLILTVLIQRPQGGGLSGAFGAGGGSGQTAFGTKTGDALTIATIAMFVIFVLFAIGLNFAARPESIDSGRTQAGPLSAESAPAPPGTPAADSQPDDPQDAAEMGADPAGAFQGPDDDQGEPQQVADPADTGEPGDITPPEQP